MDVLHGCCSFVMNVDSALNTLFKHIKIGQQPGIELGTSRFIVEYLCHSSTAARGIKWHIHLNHIVCVHVVFISCSCSRLSELNMNMDEHTSEKSYELGLLVDGWMNTPVFIHFHEHVHEQINK